MATQAWRTGGLFCIGIERGNGLSSNNFSTKPISQMPFKNKNGHKRKPFFVLSTTSRSRLQTETVKKEKIQEENVMRSSDPTQCAFQKLEEWMHDSIIEIVRHIQEAPFLHYVFDKESHLARIQTHRVSMGMLGSSDSWLGIRNSLRNVCPDGIILVQRLDEDSKCRHCSFYSDGKERQVFDGQGCTDMWGLIVEGRDVGMHACYILKTTQVVSHIGYCTHFSLIRAKCFGPSPHTQLKDSWQI